jgi:alpha-aminoadipic semialdehyde synthase
MRGVIGVRRETKSPWERRSAVTPDLARKLTEAPGLKVIVQPSARRVYHDKEYVRAGAVVSNDLSEANLIVGVKEVPPESLLPGAAYLFFAHVIKGQHHNLAMLARLAELGCTLIDYEMVRDDAGRRLIFFGRYAGLAGAMDTLWALGQRLRSEGIHSPFEAIAPAHTYSSLDEARAAVRAAGRAIESSGLPVGAPPLVIGIAGYGHVAAGVRELLSELPTTEIEPRELVSLRARDAARCLVQVTFKEEHLVEPRDPRRRFELQDYYEHPGGYRSVFARHLPRLTVLLNCNYWDERYPRLVTRDELRELYAGEQPARLKVIGDLACDIGGSVECTVKATDPGAPVYTYDPDSGAIADGVDGPGPVILAVDILPAELPREASEAFSYLLSPFLKALGEADFDRPFDALELPAEIRRAVILHRGRFTPEFARLQGYLDAR